MTQIELQTNKVLILDMDFKRLSLNDSEEVHQRPSLAKEHAWPPEAISVAYLPNLHER